MRKVWKWIIGIILGLIVLAVLVGVGFALRGGFHMARSGLGYGFYERGPQMMPYGPFHGPGMMRGFGVFPFGGILGGLIFLAFAVLIVLGIIGLVRYLRAPKAVTGTAVPAPTAGMQPAEMATCKNCGKPVQSDWKNCPYCGEKI